MTAFQNDLADSYGPSFFLPGWLSFRAFQFTSHHDQGPGVMARSIEESYANMIKAGKPYIWQDPGTDEDFDMELVRATLNRIETNLMDCVADVPKSWRRTTQPDYRFLQLCFPKAIQFVRESRHVPDAVYVLGKAVSGSLGEHGWVEIEGKVVFDGVMQQFYDLDGYYKKNSATPWYRFTRAAVMFIDRLGAKTKQDYRWDHVLGLPFVADVSNPLLVDVADARERWEQRKHKYQ